LEACEQHGATPRRLNAHAISDFAFQNDHSVCVRKPRFFEVVSPTYHSPITIDSLTCGV